MLQPVTVESVYGTARSRSNPKYQDNGSQYHQARTATVSGQTQRASFHLVDMRDLVVKAVKFVETQDDTLQGNAEYLKIPGVVSGANAGNDAWYVRMGFKELT